jgi:CRAL/TRIO domain
VKQFAVFVLEAAIAAMGEGVETFTVISDYSTFGYANMDNGLLSEGAELFMNYYPERLGNIYLTNYPFIMWGIWQVAKLLIDTKTQSKFNFVDNHEDLFEIADKSILPDFLSGDFVDHLPEDGSIGIDRLTKKD